MTLVAILIILTILFFAFEMLLGTNLAREGWLGKRLVYIRIPQLMGVLLHRSTQDGAAIHGGEEEGTFARIFSDVSLNTLVGVVVSLALLAASLFVILAGNYDPGTQKWAFGIVGSMIGYWVKPPRELSRRRKK